MRLSHVQRSRFLACIKDLKKLVTLIGQVVPETTIGNEEVFVKFILEHLKDRPIDRYGWFDLNKVDLILKLKVNKKGKIIGFAELDGKKNINSKAHFTLNQFIEGSMLRDPDIEYYESA